MLASAQFTLDENHFANRYDDWLKHRAVWRPYAVPIWLTCIVCGVASWLILPRFRLMGVMVVAFGLWQLGSGLRYRRRYIRGMLARQFAGQTMEFRFHRDRIEIATTAGEASMPLADFGSVVPGSQGFFLIPHIKGASHYIPCEAVEPAEAYESLVQQLQAGIISLEQSSGNSLLQDVRPEGDQTRSEDGL